jgi:hypothetical protein
MEMGEYLKTVNEVTDYQLHPTLIDPENPAVVDPASPIHR